MNQEKNIRKATYVEWEASLFGAMCVAFGLGTLLANMFTPYAWIIILIGAVGHAWGMYKIHKRNTL